MQPYSTLQIQCEEFWLNIQLSIGDRLCAFNLVEEEFIHPL
jgi:hypothetical protein